MASTLARWITERAVRVAFQMLKVRFGSAAGFVRPDRFPTVHAAKV
jgi:hypothetical protein